MLRFQQISSRVAAKWELIRRNCKCEITIRIAADDNPCTFMRLGTVYVYSSNCVSGVAAKVGTYQMKLQNRGRGEEPRRSSSHRRRSAQLARPPPPSPTTIAAGRGERWRFKAKRRLLLHRWKELLPCLLAAVATARRRSAPSRGEEGCGNNSFGEQI
nr:hypothetical protein Iba_scaffold15640CG0080 [Ipomoea batatas]